jgi:arylsulfatase A-like enzyme
MWFFSYFCIITSRYKAYGMMKNKRTLMKQKEIGLLTLAALAAQTAMAQRATAERPNIVFILADDMGYGDLSCFGSRHVKTPNIDRLSEEGTTFNQCYAGSGISSPSRCSLMTGLHTGHTRIRDNQCPVGGRVGMKISPQGDTTYIHRTNLMPEDTTIATVLSAAGYRTCLVNKWHLDGYDPGASPNHRGFDEFYGWTISTVHSNAPYYYPYYRFDGDQLVNIKENRNDRHIRHNTDISCDDALAFMRRQKDKEQPFFLYLAFDAPHEPYIIEEKTWRWHDIDEPFASREEKENAQRYAALIEHMDAAVGRVISFLEKEGLRENTIVIFASDNGAAVQAPLPQLRCNAGFRGRKAQLYEGGIRVPLIINQPGRVPVQRLENMVYFPDFMPTLAHLAGGDGHLPQHTDGMDISPLFFGKEVDTDHRMLYWEFTGKQRAARLGHWKCVTIKKGAPLELYNLKDDPGEQHNLAAEYPEMVQLFDEAMRRMRTPSECWPLPGE